MKKEFPPEIEWFQKFSLWLDSGFQGANTTYKDESMKVTFRRKRVKKGQTNDLTPEQLQHNKQVGSERIFVEHAIGGMKRFRILYHRIRFKNDKTLNSIINVTAGLWNLHLKFRLNERKIN